MKGEHTIEKNTLSGKRKGWMGKEKLINEFGEKRALAWIASGKLPRRADSITGSEDDDMCDFYIEQDYEEEQNTDKVKVGISIKQEIGEKDFEEKHDQIQDMASNLCDKLGVPSSSSASIKDEDDEEGGNPFDKLPIMRETKQTLNKLRDIELDAKMFKNEASNSEYANALLNDLTTFLPKVLACIKGCEKLVVADDDTILNIDEVKKLDKKVPEVIAKFDSMKSWATRFGITKAMKKARK